MGKKICWLLAMMCVMCSCQSSPPTEVAVFNVPIGIQILAYIGVAAIVVIVFGFILVMGGSPRNED